MTERGNLTQLAPGDEGQSFTAGLPFVILITAAFVAGFGIVWNAMVIIVILSTKKLRSNLGSLMVAMILALEFLMCVLIFPTAYGINSGIVSSHALKYISTIALCSLTLLSGQFQCLFAYNQYSLVCQPASHQWRTKCRLQVAAVFLTFFDLTAAAAMVILQEHTFRNFNIKIGTLMIALPLLLGCICLTLILYMKLIRFVRKFSFSLEQKRRRVARVSVVTLRLFLSWAVESLLLVLMTVLTQMRSVILLIFLLVRLNGCVRSVLYISKMPEISRVFRPITKCFQSNRIASSTYEGTP